MGAHQQWQDVVLWHPRYTEAIAYKPKLQTRLLRRLIKIKLAFIATYIIFELRIRPYHTIIFPSDKPEPLIFDYILLSIIIIIFWVFWLNTAIFMLSPIKSKVIRVLNTRMTATSAVTKLVFRVEVEYLDGITQEHHVYGDSVAVGLTEGCFGVGYFKDAKLVGFWKFGSNT